MQDGSLRNVFKLLQLSPIGSTHPIDSLRLESILTAIGCAVVSPLLLSARPLASIPSQIITPTDTSATPHLHATAALPDSSSLITSTPGSIRVRNATYHPIRIALLPQVSPPSDLASSIQQVAIAQPPDSIESEGSANTANVPSIESPDFDTSPENPQASPQYGEPMHWDFVPREGHETGLILAASNGHVKVQPGDVLTAFAQDGSRRYWGPYVVGVTEAPVWNNETQEWSLVLENPFPF